MIIDGASCVVNHMICALREAFDPESSQPPLGGGSTTVRFFAGDAVPTAAWDAHADQCNCGEPFLWVRLIRRYRSQQFPTPFVGPSPCDTPVVVAVEIGAARCAVVDVEPTWEQYAEEAEISADDSWRMELALCRAMSKIKADDDCGDLTAQDSILPYGPEGGILAWLATAYVQL